MKVSEIMTRDICLASPSQTLREAAAEMEKRDIGVLPVGDNDRLVGMITDRDIAVRGISHGLGTEAPVRDVVSAGSGTASRTTESTILLRTWPRVNRRLPVLNDRGASWVSFPSAIWPRAGMAVPREWRCPASPRPAATTVRAGPRCDEQAGGGALGKSN